MLVLSVNAGSSSLKLGMYEARAASPVGGERPRLQGRANVERVGSDEAHLTVTEPDGTVVIDRRAALADQAAAFAAALDAWTSNGTTLAPGAIGHRLVHAGPELVEHAVLDDRVRTLLVGAIPFAPLHLPV